MITVLVLLRPSSDEVHFSHLVDVIGATRLIEPRLTGGFNWAPPALHRQRGQDARLLSEIRKAASELEWSSTEHPSIDRVAEYARACLLLGETEAAVRLFEKAVRLSPQGHLRSDLAASLLVRGRPQDASGALAWADRAIALDKKIVEAWFNRAVALEQLSLITQARNAWLDYLDVDSESDWAHEARVRLHWLRPDDYPARWALERERLLNPKRELDLARVVGSYPQECRELIEDELLPLWGERVLANQDAAAAPLLQRASALAAEVTRYEGDRLPLAMVQVLGTSVSSKRQWLAQGHMAYGRARRLYDRLDYGKAEPFFRDSRDALERAGSPFASWAAIHLAIIDYQRRELNRAAATLGEIHQNADQFGYLTLAGRSEWILSLIDTSRGEFASAFARLERALAVFRRTRETENIAAVQTILAEQTRLMGQATRSWDYLRDALAALPRVRRLTRQQATLFTAATTALRQHLPESGLYFQQAFIEAAQRSGAPIATAEGYLHSARLHLELKKPHAARADLKDAREWLKLAGEHALKDLIEPQVLLVEASLLEATSSPQATEKIRQALRGFQRGARATFLPRTYLALARSYRRSGDLAAAEHALSDGLIAFEQQQQSLRGSPLRVSFFDEGWGLFEELLTLHIDSGHPDAAFRVAEKGRSRILTEAVVGDTSVVDLITAKKSIPSNVVLIAFSVTAKRWFVWVVTAAGHQLVVQDTPVTQLEALVRAYRLAIEYGREAEFARATSALYNELFRPLRDYIQAGSQLVIIPDGILHLVPFPALRSGGRFLVEDHDIVIAPSITIAVHSTLSPRPDPTSALVVGNPAFSRASHSELSNLPRSEHEAREVAQVYPQSKLLIGPRATRTRFLASLWNRDIVHFAGHALANAEYPSLSSLLLAPDAANASSQVFAYEVEAGGSGQARRPQLIVLSACATAEGPRYRGEGVLSLARPFLMAGVPAVVASYWRLDDGTTWEFFARVHLTFRAGDSAARSLRQAQIEAIRSGRSPRQWAAFSVFGSIPPMSSGSIVDPDEEG